MNTPKPLVLNPDGAMTDNEPETGTCKLSVTTGTYESGAGNGTIKAFSPDAIEGENMTPVFVEAGRKLVSAFTVGL